MVVVEVVVLIYDGAIRWWVMHSKARGQQVFQMIGLRSGFCQDPIPASRWDWHLQNNSPSVVQFISLPRNVHRSLWCRFVWTLSVWIQLREVSSRYKIIEPMSHGASGWFSTGWRTFFSRFFLISFLARFFDQKMQCTVLVGQKKCGVQFYRDKTNKKQNSISPTCS